jgi:hypothetical protein
VKGKMGRISMCWKTSILVVTVLLVLISGCSSLGGHSVTGSWKQDASQGATTAIVVMTFHADGTGSYKFDSTTPGFSQMDWHISYSFTWRMTDSSVAGSSSKTIEVIPDEPGRNHSFQMDYYPNEDTLTMPTSLYEFVRIS